MTSRLKLHLAAAALATALSAPAYADSSAKPWNETFGEEGNESTVAVVPMKNGGVAVAATTDSTGNGGTDAWIFTLDANGGMIWEETIGGKKDDVPNALIQMPDGGFAMAGTTESMGKGGADAWVVRLDAKGNVLWQKTLGKEGDDQAISLVAAPDGGLTVAGMTDPKGEETSAPWITRLAADGTYIALIALKRPQPVEVTGLTRVPDGLVLSGWKKSDGKINDAAWAFKIDPKGKTIWESTLAQPGTQERVYAAAVGKDGNIILGGQTKADTKDVGTLLIKLNNKTGEPIWSQRNFVTGRLADIASLAVYPTGTILATGRAAQTKEGNNNLWIGGFSKEGLPFWEALYGEEEHDEGTSLAIAADQQLIVGGWSNSFGQGGSDAWVLKLPPKK